METVTHQTISPVYTGAIRTAQPSLLSRFLSWCEGQEKNHFGWLATILAVHGFMATPLTLFAIILAGNNIVFWIVAATAMMMSLVTNLAAMPTKITIPTFILSLIIDLTLVLLCVFNGFNIAGTYI